jgi:hypothetical protein
MADDGGNGDDDGDGGWRFGIDEVGPDSDDDGEEGEEGNVLGSTDAALEDPEPGAPTAENAFFVLLGAATIIGIVALLVL